MKKLFKISVSKVYIMYLLLLTVFIIGTYSSYAYFTVNKEKKNAIKMVTGNLVGELKVDGVVNDKLVVEAKTSKFFSIELINKNDRRARFNFYYKGDLKEGVEVGYIQNDGYNTMPSETGVNLEANGTLGYYQKYRIKVKNNTNDSITIPLGYSIGLDYNDLTLPNNGHLFGEMKMNPNEPKLASNMIPVRYDGSNWVKADKSNWYNYEAQEWANAVTIDNSKVLDLSSNNNHGTLMNGASLSNEGVTLDGDDDYIDCGFTNYNFKNQIAFVIRFKLLEDFQNEQGWNHIFGSLFEDENKQIKANGVIHYDGRNGQIWFGLFSKEENKYYDAKSPTHSLNIGQYYTIVGTYDGSMMKLYIDGIKQGEIAAQINIKESTFPITIGDLNSSDISTNIEVSDALIFDKGLSDEEVKEHYSNEVSLGNTMPLAYYTFKQGENINNNTIIPMDLINTMWVWIPRYSYTIGSEDGTSYYGKKGEFLDTAPTQKLPGEIDVEFVDKNTKDRGSAKYKVSEGASGWYTPDGFTFGDEELEGIWIGKFETSNKENNFSDNDSLTPIIKPKVTSWRSIRVSTLETVSLKMNKANNVYGFVESEVDTHAIKRSEWALISYLSQSKYGKLGNEIYKGINKEVYNNNYMNCKTGCSSGDPSSAKSSICSHEYDEIEDRGEGKGAAGAGASTTGNIYGIYDINGGAWEYVMGNFNGYTGNTESLNSGYNGLLTNGTEYNKGIPYPAEKYYDKYITGDKNIISHALGETAGWYGDAPDMITSTLPWMVCGGHWDRTTDSGVFSFYTNGAAGSTGAIGSFRVVLTMT